MSRARVAILISGSGSNMVRLVEDMKRPDHPAKPVLVLSNTPDAAGLAKARALGVDALAVDHRGKDRADFEALLNAALHSHKPDIICLAGFMRVLSADFVAGWQGQILNIHPSLLPAFKGLDTHHRALQAGVAVHGCTVHVVTPDLDDGPILGQAVVDIASNETAETLAQRVLVMEHRLYPKVLERFATGDTRKLALFE